MPNSTSGNHGHIIIILVEWLMASYNAKSGETSGYSTPSVENTVRAQKDAMRRSG
jgi:hypothetical protein